MRICDGPSGVTSNWSNVPCSRSFAMDMPASSMTCVNEIIAMRLGTKFHCVSWFGSYHVRDWIVMPPVPMRSAFHVATIWLM